MPCYWKEDDQSNQDEPNKPNIATPANNGSSDIDAAQPQGLKPTLREYQQAAVDAHQTARNNGVHRIGLSAPTGAGKTVVFAAIIHRELGNRKKGELESRNRGKALVVVNSEELADQAMNKILDEFDENVLIGHERNTLKAGPRDNVIIATYQTLGREKRMKDFKKRFQISDFKLVVVDEAHHAAADSYLRILSEFNNEVKVENCESGFTMPNHNFKIPIVGVSATFTRHDDRALGWVFEEVVHECSLEELWTAGHLVPIKIWKLSEYPRVVPGPNGQAIEVSQPIVPPIYRDLDDGDVSEDEADCSLGDVHTNWDQYLAALHEFNSRVVMYYQAQAAGRKSTLVFCSRIHAVHELEKHFHAAGIDTRSISSRTIESERNSIVNSFRKGEFPVLINCMMLIEGYDAPQIDCIVIARPTKSIILHNQMIGRATRLSPKTEKTDCLVIDLVGNCDHFPLGVGPNLLSKRPADADENDKDEDD